MKRNSHFGTATDTITDLVNVAGVHNRQLTGCYALFLARDGARS